MNRHHLRTSLILLLLSTASIHAEDLRPPHYRGADKSTTAGWDFASDPGRDRIKPDAAVPLKRGKAWEPLSAEYVGDGPYPTATLFGDASYWPGHGGGILGGPHGTGGLVFTIPAWLEPALFQRLRVQVTYLGPDPKILVAGFDGLPGVPKNPDNILPLSRTPVTSPALQPGAYFFYEDWLIWGSAPTWEQIVIFVPAETIVLSVIIDTDEPLHPLFGDGFEDADGSSEPRWLDQDLLDIFQDGFEKGDSMPWPWPRSGEGGNGNGG